MRICHCTLGSTNPNACKSCLNNYEGDYDGTGKNIPTKNVKRLTKTIERYGPNGEYLGKEVIITEEENIQKLDWTLGYVYTDSQINHNLLENGTYVIGNKSFPAATWSYSTTGIVS